MLWLVAVAINLALLGVGSSLDLRRPLFNLDYLFGLAALAWRRNHLAAALLVVGVVGDMTYQFLPAYLFTDRAFSLQFLMQSLSALPNSLLVVFAFVLLVATTGLSYGMTHVRSFVKHPVVTCLALGLAAVFVFFLDAINGTNSLLGTKDRAGIPVKVAFSPFYSIARVTLNGFQESSATISPLRGDASASYRYVAAVLGHNRNGLAGPPTTDEAKHKAMAGFLAARGGRNLAVILVESLGSPVTDPDRLQLMAPLLALTNRYTAQAGHFFQSGSTVNAEFRAFTWSQLEGVSIPPLPGFALPKWFLDQGYETVAIHGFHETMYGRNRWYSQAGFSRSIFLGDMQAERETELRGILFRGVSDGEAAHWVRRELRAHGSRGKPAFVYWLTLSGHLPVDVGYSRDLVGASLPAPPDAGASLVPPDVAAHEIIMTAVVAILRDLATDPEIPPTDFIVAGDHTPPFRTLAAKTHYLPNTVPYLLLFAK